MKNYLKIQVIFKEVKKLISVNIETLKNKILFTLYSHKINRSLL